MKRNLTLGLILGAISMALGTFAGIKTLTNTKVQDAEAVTYYGLSSNIHTSPSTGTHYLWTRSGTIPNYDPEMNNGGFNVNDSYCTQGSSNSYVSSYFNEYSNATTPYVQVGPTSKQSTYTYAFYAPLYIRYTVVAKTVIHYPQILNIELEGDGTAVKSAEMFYFDFATHSSYWNVNHPNQFWYVRNDTTTTNTGMPYSIGRVFSNWTGTKTGQLSFQMDYKNETDEDVDVYFHLGLFAYMEAPGSPSQSFKCRVSAQPSQSRTPLVTVNNVMYIDFNEAVEAYNAASYSSMSFKDDVTLANDITLSSKNGSIFMNGNTLNCGTYGLTFANTTVFSTGTITGSADTLLTVDAPNITVDFGSNFNINHSGLTTINMTENATSSFVVVNETDTITNTNTNTAATIVSLNAGSFAFAGTLVSNSATQNSIKYGTGTPSKAVYLYGNSSVNGFINVHSNTDSTISARYNGAAYTGTNNVKVKTSGTWNIGDRMVFNVTDSNYEKFVLTKNYCEFVKNGTGLFIAATQYNVVFYLTNVTQTSGGNTGTYFDMATFVFAANEGYVLPDTITIRVAGSVLNKSYYSWNKTTGAVVINKNRITAYVTITIVALQSCTVSFLNPDGSIAADSINVVQNSKVTFPSLAYNKPNYKTFHVWTQNSDGSGSYYYSGDQTTITNDTTFYAHYYVSDYDKLDEFQGIQLHFDVDVIDENDNTDTGACITNGYYATAKEAYNAFSSSLKQKFNTYSAYQKGRARLEAWARANGETIDTSTYEIVPLNANPIIKLINDNNAFVLIIIVISMVSITGVALFLLRKKRVTKQ